MGRKARTVSKHLGQVHRDGKERPPRDARQTATIKRGVFSEKPLKFCAEALARVRGTR